MCHLSVEVTDLPNSVQELAELIGLEAVWKLVQARGGRRLTVPKTIHSEHWLLELIGEPSLINLIERFNGEEIEIPVCNIAKRRAAVAEFVNMGRSISEAAAEFGMTRRGIQKMLRILERQGRLNKPQT